MTIQDYIRGNNRFWLGLYYDELVDESSYQLTYCAQADEPYLNCAQAVSAPPPFTEIESYYQHRNSLPAFYTDSENERWLVPLLTNRQYQEIPSQNESIWGLQLSPEKIEILARTRFSDYEELELREVHSLHDLKTFHRIDVLCNELPPLLAQSLLDKLQKARIKEVESKHFIICANGLPAGCCSMGLCKNTAYLAEDGVLPEYRRRGFHCYSMQQRIISAYKQRASCVLTTCSTDSFTNLSAKKTGMSLMCTRRFFQAVNS